jgi:hypothetical protein
MISLYINILLAVFSIFSVLEAAEWSISFLAALFIVWTVLPYVIFAALEKRKLFCRFCLRPLAQTLIAIPAALVYGHQLAYPDAQGGLVFFFVPLLQLAMGAPLALLGLFVKNRERTQGSKS